MRYLTIIVLIIIYGCEQPYEIDLKVRDYVVIDGYITNEIGSSNVKLSKANNFNKNAVNSPISGALVYIHSSNLEVFELQELNNSGIYLPKNEAFASIENLEYWVEIEYNGKMYSSIPSYSLATSNYEIIINQNFQESVNKQLNIVQQFGYDIQVNVSNEEISDSIAQYFKWEWYTWYESQSGRVVTEYPHKYINIVESTEKYLQSTYFIDFKAISGPPERTYNLVVTQKALTRDAYFYWTSIRNQLANEGSIFDRQPETILGNVYSSDSTETVLGYVLVGDISSKTIIIE